MRALTIIGLTLAALGVVVYWKRDAIEDWLSDFASDRIVYAIEHPTEVSGAPGEVALGLQAYGLRLAKDTGRKTLTKIDPKILAQRFLG